MKKGDITLEMLAIYILAAVFIVVVLYLIFRNRTIIERLISMFGGLR